jgi:hypothetical protein
MRPSIDREGSRRRVLAAVWPGRTIAEIHDYMILRLLYLHSSCGALSLERLESTRSNRRFMAKCRDVTSFPDGLTVLCTDPDDDRSCRIETAPKTFDNLDLLKR